MCLFSCYQESTLSLIKQMTHLSVSQMESSGGVLFVRNCQASLESHLQVLVTCAVVDCSIGPVPRALDLYIRTCMHACMHRLVLVAIAHIASHIICMHKWIAVALHVHGNISLQQQTLLNVLALFCQNKQLQLANQFSYSKEQYSTAFYYSYAAEYLQYGRHDIARTKTRSYGSPFFQ